ncbi:MAG: sugar transferase [Desulfobacterales bacterium]|nr:sugar transferase [Desulfobacterales bacterium]
MRIKISNLIGLLAMIFLWHMIYRFFRLYRSRRLQNYTREWKDIVKSTTAGTLIFFLCGKVFNTGPFTPMFALGFWLSTTFLTISFRTLLRYALKKVRAYGRNLRFVLIVGTNERAYAFARAIEGNRELGYHLAGYVDDVLHTAPKQEIKLLGTLKDFPNIIRNRVIDEVIIALPIKSQYEGIQAIIHKAEEQGITIRCLYHLFNTKISTSSMAILGGLRIPVLEIASGRQDNTMYPAKRAVDIVLGFTLLILTLPVMIVAAIAIKLTSPGPVFFVQDRVGYNKRIFPLYKFRTMIVGAEKTQQELEAMNEMDGPVFKIRDDPRVTKVGQWLRKTSIDELPQLHNVLRGHMSLVGPRPLPVRDYNGFKDDWQRRRFSVRPGLTCLWQVNGRNHTCFDDWMKLDMKYIDNWTFLGDMKILLKTIPVVFNGKGAS